MPDSSQSRIILREGLDIGKFLEPFRHFDCILIAIRQRNGRLTENERFWSRKARLLQESERLVESRSRIANLLYTCTILQHLFHDFPWDHAHGITKERYPIGACNQSQSLHPCHILQSKIPIFTKNTKKARPILNVRISLLANSPVVVG